METTEIGQGIPQVGGNLLETKGSTASHANTEQCDAVACLVRVGACLAGKIWDGMGGRSDASFASSLVSVERGTKRAEASMGGALSDVRCVGRETTRASKMVSMVARGEGSEELRCRQRDSGKEKLVRFEMLPGHANMAGNGAGKKAPTGRGGVPRDGLLLAARHEGSLFQVGDPVPRTG